ncbi:MAG: D-alanyl-D-alanine carboxypeptidase/D-alanyl-D-alanine-endopeptidase [Nannocystaceae bacterium]
MLSALTSVLAGLLLLAAPRDPGAAAAASPQAAAAPTRADLKATLDGFLAVKPLAKATIGVVVIDVATGEELYTHEPDAAVNPASNTKVVTTAAALSILGPEHRFVTRLYAGKGTRKAGSIDGDLYLKGGGDPWLVTADLYELAGDLRALGITKVNGRIVVDSSAFDRDELPPAFDQKQEFAAFRAPSSATSVNFNTYVVWARPGDDGKSAALVLDPPTSLVTVASAITLEPGRRNRVTVERGTPAKGVLEALTFAGTLGVDAGAVSYRYPIAEPTLYAGDVLRAVLEQRGIKVQKSTIVAGTAPKDAEEVAMHASQPLSVLCRGVNKLSNNFMAEQILKSLDAGPDHPATFAGGLDRVRQFLDGLGIAGEGLRLGNGSGLYDANRVTARQLARLLAAVHGDFRISADFLASLPILGADGTLRSRLSESQAARYVRAKTGTLDEASSLAGYAGTVGHPPLAFAILIGDIDRGKLKAAREAQNQIAEHLARLAAAPR